MEYNSQSSYFNSNQLKRFILYKQIRTNKLFSINTRTINLNAINADISNANIKYANITKTDISDSDISYSYIHDLEVKKANIDNLNVKHDITLNNNPYLPIGIVLPYATDNNEPEGWLFCNGQEVSKTTYQSLWLIIGNKFGLASNPNNFKLPDLQGRVIVGSGSGSGLTSRSIGQNGGAETHTLTTSEIPSHNHTGTTSTNGDHTHTVGNTVQKDGNGTPGSIDNEGSEINTTYTINTTTSTNGNHNHTFTTNNTGGGQAHNNMQPFTVLNYIIKYRV
jgi:microcystin-dependent protein